MLEKRGSVDPKNISGRNYLKEDLPEGKPVMTLVKEKDRTKSDLFGKSDHYSMITYGSQQHEIPVTKITHKPIWNHEVDFEIPDGNDGISKVEVIDSDKVGNDKSRGKYVFQFIVLH